MAPRHRESGSSVASTNKGWASPGLVDAAAGKAVLLLLGPNTVKACVVRQLSQVESRKPMWIASLSMGTGWNAAPVHSLGNLLLHASPTEQRLLGFAGGSCFSGRAQGLAHGKAVRAFCTSGGLGAYRGTGAKLAPGIHHVRLHLATYMCHCNVCSAACSLYLTQH